MRRPGQHTSGVVMSARQEGAKEPARERDSTWTCACGWARGAATSRQTPTAWPRSTMLSSTALLLCSKPLPTLASRPWGPRSSAETEPMSCVMASPGDTCRSTSPLVPTLRTSAAAALAAKRGPKPAGLYFYLGLRIGSVHMDQRPSRGAASP